MEGDSQTLRLYFQENGIRTVYKSEIKLQNILKYMHDKESVPKARQDGVAFMIPCSDCESVYIGETRRAV